MLNQILPLTWALPVSAAAAVAAADMHEAREAVSRTSPAPAKRHPDLTTIDMGGPLIMHVCIYAYMSQSHPSILAEK